MEACEACFTRRMLTGLVAANLDLSGLVTLITQAELGLHSAHPAQGGSEYEEDSGPEQSLFSQDSNQRQCSKYRHQVAGST